MMHSRGGDFQLKRVGGMRRVTHRKVMRDKIYKHVAGKEKKEQRFRAAWPFFLQPQSSSASLPSLNELGLLH